MDAQMTGRSAQGTKVSPVFKSSNMWRRRWIWSPDLSANESFEPLCRFGDIWKVVRKQEAFFARYFPNLLN
jgi:hypothetical protein